MRKFIYSYRFSAPSMDIRRRLFLSLVLLPLAGCIMAQSDQLNELSAKLEAYHSRALQEKLFVNTDKPSYLAGEICWMKLYCVDGSFHKPLDLSKIAYVELLDKDDRFVLQGKISLDGGEGKGSFFLPLSLISGNYKLRAYTNWMKNFGPDHFFEKQVTVINTLKDLPPSNPSPASYNIAFFPEGGDLIKDISSRVGFQVTDRYGKGVGCLGIVLDEKGDTAAVFSPLRAGIGDFLFTPSGNHMYRALIRWSDKDSLVKELPAAREQGYAMRVEEGEKGRLKVTVHVHGSFPGNISLFGQCRGLPRLALWGEMVQNSASFLIDKDSLGEGVNQLTLFNPEGKPVCERLYFRRPAGRLSIGVSSDQQQYGIRKKVSLDIRAAISASAIPAERTDAGSFSPSSQQSSGTAVVFDSIQRTAWSASMSLSVYRIDSLQSPQGEDIYAYWWLGSELRGRIEDPDYYLSAQGPAADQAVDDLMLTHGWRRFRWENILENRQSSFTYPPEYKGQIIMGRLTDSHTGEPVRNRLSFLSVPGTQFQFQTARTDSAGKMFFDISNYYGPGSIVIQSGMQSDSACKVDIFTPFSEQYTSERLSPFGLSPAPRQSLVDRSIGMQVENIWSGDSLQKFRAPFLDTLRFYGRPDYSYQLDDYVRFTTTEEVLREYVREVNVNHLHGRLHVLMLNEPHHEFFEDENTLILLDGVAVGDRIFSYDPLKIKKLDVIPRMYFQGPAFFSGIASFTTYKGDYEGAELDPRSVLVDYEGLQWQREFYSPVYATDEQAASRLPDFRNLLYWRPDIHTFGPGNAPCSFYTSDLPGKYLVIVQGMGADGQAGSGTTSFEVK